MKRYIGLLPGLLFAFAGFAQKSNAQNVAVSLENEWGKSFTMPDTSRASDVDTERYYVKVEHPPEFTGGTDSLELFLARNTRYPKEARRANKGGRVVVRFVVERDGTISDVVATTGLGWGLEEESVRIVEMMPKWKPGTIKGIAVKSYYLIPIIYKLK